MAAFCFTIAVFFFRFQAYVHANAMMWKVCFKELRALTNTKQLSLSGLNVNPMELNNVYEHVWNVGVLLESDLCLSILEPEPHRGSPSLCLPREESASIPLRCG